jgi:hypothetical protein
MYAKVLVSASLPQDPELSALRAWITNSKAVGGPGSVHYRYVSFRHSPQCCLSAG